MADRKSRQMLHRAKKMNPEAVVVACGCYVQAMKDKVDESIDIIVGNNHKKDIVSILEEYEQERSEQIHQMQTRPDPECQDREEQRPQDQAHSGRMYSDEDINRTSEYEELSLSQTAGHTRAYIKVQDGCNQFCSYCIIPYARGRVRSRKYEQVIEEVKTLAANGYKEVVLTGIHLSSYGIDTGDSLLSLIEGIHEVEGIRRIRLGSLEPRIITEEFASTLASLPKVCPHFHLSLQSGCDATLKRMNRRYTSDEYYEKCELLRKYFKNPALTTDVIVGFPGETEEEFAQSRDFVDKVNFYETHIFKYSRREGTKAAVMPDQVPEQIKTLRSNELIELGRRKQAEYEEALIGTTQEVLIEEEIQRDGESWQIGHTKEYVKIGCKRSENVVNQVVNVKIENHLQILH
jgi:threonylcarbamoyladenosine tRNA methylthiotransferase MtaB